jgi:hypothetical protein
MAYCAGCHGDALGGVGETPALVGDAFRTNRLSGSPDGLFNFITEAMPLNLPGTLAPHTYADITAFILSKNGVAPGATDLPADPAVLATMTIPAVGGGSAAQGQGSCGASVTAQAGDTLSSIAQRCGTTVEALRQANPAVDPLQLQVGATIVIRR